MKYNIWYKTSVGIWVNGSETSSEETAKLQAIVYEDEGHIAKIIPEGNPAPYEPIPSDI